MGNVVVSTANVPEGFCPSWMIEKWPELVSLLSAQLNGSLNTFNYGSSTPDPSDQDKPWLKLDANGYPDGQYWVFNNGFWVKKHPLPVGSIMLWEGDITAIDTFDGGETAAVSVLTGPMWEQVTGLKGRFPVGAGPLPTSGTIVNPTDTGGEENHTLTLSELPAHSHTVNAKNDESGGTGGDRLRPVTDPNNATVTSQEVGDDQPHNNMPPYYGIHFIRRTQRQFYRA